MNNNLAIHIEGLGKRYQLGQTVDLKKTFRETLVDAPRIIGSRAIRTVQRMLPRSRVPREIGIQKDDDPETPPGTLWALKDINLKIKQGDVVGIIGRNGAGKSTLLKIISRITTPTRGEIEIHGRVGSLLEVGTGFHEELTGRENIYLNGAILGMSKSEIDRKFQEIIDFAGTEDFLDTPIKRYSSGMAVRLAFSVAAHLDPDILIVDEVLAVGDLEFQKKCMNKMENITKEKRTVLFVSHNMSAIRSFCKKVLVLHEGKKQFYGDVLEGIDHYVSMGFNEHEASVSLTSHHNRPDHFSPVFRDLQMLSNDVSTSNILMGGELKICIQFESAKPVRHVGIAFEDILGTRLCYLATTHQNPDLLGKAPSKGKIVCRVPDLRLLPGNYYISLYARSYHYDIDKIEKAASFTVIPDDVYKTGVLPPPSKGVFYTHANWDYSAMP